MQKRNNEEDIVEAFLWGACLLMFFTLVIGAIFLTEAKCKNKWGEGAGFDVLTGCVVQTPDGPVAVELH